MGSKVAHILPAKQLKVAISIVLVLASMLFLFRLIIDVVNN